MQLWALIIDGFRESLDRKIFWVVLLITAVVTAAMACIGFDGDRITVLFGLWETETSHYNPLTTQGRSALLGSVVYVLLMFFLGWVGIILILVATASFFPSMLESGAIDVLVSKPISRPRLYLYKYLSGMVFVFVQATIFILLTFLVMGIRWRVWAPGYLLCIPLMVLLFSYIYCVSTLVAVRTRSAIAAILISLAAWFLYTVPNAALGVFETFPELRDYRVAHKALEVAAWIPPKTSDIPYLAARWSGAGTSLDVFPTEMMGDMNATERGQIARARELEEKELMKNPWLSIGSSLLFEAIIVLWGMWLFSRKDF
jgi:ABC-type transport system involved in multi-copper enzyme maturation permease subunit